jgi:uncharacterized protein with ParB-like and HNH nuclease domain
VVKMTAQKRALDKIYKRRDRYEIPDWQREDVWDRTKQQGLIDSILRGWKLPEFYFLKTSSDPDEFEVLDGQQRLSLSFSITNFRYQRNQRQNLARNITMRYLPRQPIDLMILKSNMIRSKKLVRKIRKNFSSVYRQDCRSQVAKNSIPYTAV